MAIKEFVSYEAENPNFQVFQSPLPNTAYEGSPLSPAPGAVTHRGVHFEAGQGASGSRVSSPGNGLISSHECPWGSTKVELKVK